jgi:hypothetical protein
MPSVACPLPLKQNRGTKKTCSKALFKNSDIWDQVKINCDTQPGFNTSQSFNPSTLSSSLASIKAVFDSSVFLLGGNCGFVDPVGPATSVGGLLN